ncbi:hypothetical protein [Agarilytica rhodophyticola]|uniref:hypothetical protein n=1 Tax=Agarilytica rhodophyticola TaxID=1737490 RepID=UPI000CD993F7|nr:hypothetical protein [Agarilytica rhodophyticola]
MGNIFFSLLKKNESEDIGFLMWLSYIKKIVVFFSTAMFSCYASSQDENILKTKIEELEKKVEILNRKIDDSGLSDTSSSSELGGENSERIAELEESLWSIEERLGQRAIVQAFDGIRLDIGGFIHTAYTNIDGEDNRDSSFDRQNFELLIGAELDEEWSAFFAGGFLRESDPSLSFDNRTSPVFNSRNKNPQIIGWVNYSASSLFNMRIGRMITPHGIINIEHFPATLLDPEQPQFLRPFSGDTIFPNFATGIQLHGKKYFSVTSFEYATYVTNMSSNADELQLGGRMALGFIDDKLSLGVNYANGTRADDVNYDMSGVDFKLDIGALLLKSEYYQTSEDTSGMGDMDRKAFYIQPAIQLSNTWILFARYDRLDRGEVIGKSTEMAAGLNFLPSPRVRLRAIFTAREYEGGGQANADADIMQISGTFSF